jgi:hypothetical protein
MPTWFGIFVSASLMAVTIIIHQFASIRQALGIPGGIDLQRMVSGSLDTFATHIFGQSRTNTVVVALFWAIVGVFVYVLVLGISGAMREFGSDIKERSYLWPREANPHKPLKGLIERVGVHMLAIVILALYVFLPLAVVLHGPLLLGSSLAQTSGLLYATWFVLGTITWHGLTVVLRLLFLRDRLLGLIA